MPQIPLCDFSLTVEGNDRMAKCFVSGVTSLIDQLKTMEDEFLSDVSMPDIEEKKEMMELVSSNLNLEIDDLVFKAKKLYYNYPECSSVVDKLSVKSQQVFARILHALQQPENLGNLPEYTYCNDCLSVNLVAPIEPTAVSECENQSSNLTSTAPSTAGREVIIRPCDSDLGQEVSMVSKIEHTLRSPVSELLYEDSFRSVRKISETSFDGNVSNVSNVSRKSTSFCSKYDTKWPSQEKLNESIRSGQDDSVSLLETSRNLIPQEIMDAANKTFSESFEAQCFSSATKNNASPSDVKLLDSVVKARDFEEQLRPDSLEESYEDLLTMPMPPLSSFRCVNKIEKLSAEKLSDHQSLGNNLQDCSQGSQAGFGNDKLLTTVNDDLLASDWLDISYEDLTTPISNQFNRSESRNETGLAAALKESEESRFLKYKEDILVGTKERLIRYFCEKVYIRRENGFNEVSLFGDYNTLNDELIALNYEIEKLQDPFVSSLVPNDFDRRIQAFRVGILAKVYAVANMIWPLNWKTDSRSMLEQISPVNKIAPEKVTVDDFVRSCLGYMIPPGGLFSKVLPRNYGPENKNARAAKVAIYNEHQKWMAKFVSQKNRTKVHYEALKKRQVPKENRSVMKHSSDRPF